MGYIRRMRPFDFLRSRNETTSGTSVPPAQDRPAPGDHGNGETKRSLLLAPPASVTISLSVLAVLGVLGLLHYAASVFITIFSSILIAIALEPPVRALHLRLRLPRHVGSMIVVFLAVGSLYGILYFAYTGAQGFLTDLPALADKIRTAPIIESATERMHGFERGLDAFKKGLVPPVAPVGKSPQVIVSQDNSFMEKLFSGLGSITSVVFSLSFIPFLVYFILAEKDSLTRRTLALFPDREARMRALLTEIEEMMQTFLVGNAIIAAILSSLTILLFWAAGLPYWLVLGALSGIMSTVPYLGLVLAMVPALIVGLVSFDSGLPLLAIVAGVTTFHLLAANYLIPRLVGGRTHLNAVSSTLAILFFGWMWGGMGLLLAIPIASVLRSVLESNPGTQPLGQWLGD